MSVESNSTVLLLKAPKAEEQTDNYCQTLTSEGFKSYSVPALAFTFVNLNALHDALLSASRYSCLVLTSPRSVEAIQKAFTASSEWFDSVSLQWASKPTFVVGTATATAAAKLGLEIKGAESGNAATLAPLIVNDLKSLQLVDQHALMPCGQLALETLPTTLRNQGIQVDCLTVYETVADPSLADTLQTFIQTHGRPHYIVFFSPSIVRFSHLFLDRLTLLDNSVKLIAIGPSTETEMRSTFGRVSGTAGKPTAQHVCDTIKQLQSVKTLNISPDS